MLFLQSDRPLALLIAGLIALSIAIVVHELAHAGVAWLMGDSTGIDQGKTRIRFTNPVTRTRQTLTFINPLAYVNLIGFLMFLFIGFGFLGQAPVNPGRMRNPRWGLTASVAAGPLSNLLVAVLAGIPWMLGWLPASPFIGSDVLPSITEVGYYIIFWNALLCFFNLIPLYPLDGWTIVLGLLPTDLAYTWERYRTQSYYLFFILIIISVLRIPGLPSPLQLLIGEPTSALVRVLTGL